MNLVLELAEIEKQVSALISENINLKKENKELTEQNTSLLTSVENLNKSVQELEAEVKEWKDKADLWCKTANLKDHNIMINKELEKENAELKEKLGDIQMQKAGEKSDLVWHLKEANEQKAEQLTKAKEIIKKIEKIFYSGENAIKRLSEISDILAEAEQFLKDNA